MAIRLGYWDCSSCGQKRIRGPERTCPGCGKPRDPSVAFYTDDQAEVVEAPEQVARARAGADWTCPYCGADNPKNTAQCIGCGATSEGSKSRAAKDILDVPPPSPVPQRTGSAGKALAIIAVVLFLLGAGLYALFFRTKPLTVAVESATWVKAIHLERLETQRKEAWKDEVPSSAREIRRFTDHRQKKVQVGTEKVKTGKRDLGNGYFEDIFTERPKYEERSVEDTRVVYEIDRWVQDRTLKNESRDGREPEAPQLAASARERIGRRENKIVLELKGDNGKSYSYEVDLEAHPDLKAGAGAYTAGKQFTAHVNAVGGVMRLEAR